MPTGNDVRKQLQCSKQHLIHLHYLPPTHTHTQFYSIQFINVVLIHSNRQPPVSNHLVIAGKKISLSTGRNIRQSQAPGGTVIAAAGLWGKNRKEDHRETAENRNQWCSARTSKASSALLVKSKFRHK